jgi:hypothetical protein
MHYAQHAHILFSIPRAFLNNLRECAFGGSAPLKATKAQVPKVPLCHFTYCVVYQCITPSMLTSCLASQGPSWTTCGNVHLEALPHSKPPKPQSRASLAFRGSRGFSFRRHLVVYFKWERERAKGKTESTSRHLMSLILRIQTGVARWSNYHRGKC